MNSITSTLSQNDRRRLVTLEAIGIAVRNIELHAEGEKRTNPQLSKALMAVAGSLEKRQAKLLAVSRKAGLI